MDDFDTGAIFGVITTLIVYSIVMFAIVIPIQDAHAVKHGCAEYNKTTGDFQWLDLKDK